MGSLVSGESIDKCLRDILKSQGYKLNSPRAYGQTGVDIRASKEGEVYYIEVIGYKSSGSSRAKDFYEVFFRVISRLNDQAEHCVCVIALPKQFAVGLPARAKQHSVAWARIAEAFPELEIWLVDTDNNTFEKTAWVYWVNSER